MEKPINKFCPRSGKPIANNSLTQYRGYTVGFCNPDCKDDFASDTSIHLSDRNYFDVIIKEREL